MKNIQKIHPAKNIFSCCRKIAVNIPLKKFQLFKKLTQVFLLFFYSSFSYSASKGGDTATTFVHNLCNYLSGDLAKAIGVLAIIGFGYSTLNGRMHWQRAAMIVLGMAMIMGGAHYGSVIMGGN